MRLNCILQQRFRKSVGELVGDVTLKHSNLPKRYVERTMRQVYWKNPDKLGYNPGKTLERKKFKFGIHRPWEFQFYEANTPGSEPPDIPVQPVKWMFFKGDRVEILDGPDKGKQGLVNYVVQERNFVFVEGLNCKPKFEGKTDDYPGILRKVEQPLLVTTEVALVDPTDGKPTQCEWRYTEEGEKVRVSVRTERILPIPTMDEETIDYKTRSTYKEEPKDTTTEELTKITFEPVLKTFEMDIMDSMGIQEDRIPAKTYWY